MTRVEVSRTDYRQREDFLSRIQNRWLTSINKKEEEKDRYGKNSGGGKNICTFYLARHDFFCLAGNPASEQICWHKQVAGYFISPDGLELRENLEIFQYTTGQGLRNRSTDKILDPVLTQIMQTLFKNLFNSSTTRRDELLGISLMVILIKIFQ
jgi:hypothetical protein